MVIYLIVCYINKGGVKVMNKRKMVMAEILKKTAEHAMKRDANSTTCVAVFQPKVPKDLDRFKMFKK